MQYPFFILIYLGSFTISAFHYQRHSCCKPKVQETDFNRKIFLQPFQYISYILLEQVNSTFFRVFLIGGAVTVTRCYNQLLSLFHR